MASHDRPAHRTIRFPRGIAVALMALRVAAALGQAPVRPAPELSDQFESNVRAVLAAADPAARAQALEPLRAMDSAELIPRLVRFSAHADNTRDGMAAGVIIDRLGLSRSQVIAGLAPYLGSRDDKFDNSIRGILRSYEGREGGRPPDFSIYRELVEDAFRAGKHPPTALVLYLYESDPGAALLMMMRASGVHDPDAIKSILWSEHVVADALWRQQYGFLKPDQSDPAAARELSRLARRPEWWSRLYVVEILHQHQAFRRDSLVAALKRDPDERVRGQAGRLGGH